MKLSKCREKAAERLQPRAWKSFFHYMEVDCVRKYYPLFKWKKNLRSEIGSITLQHMAQQIKLQSFPHLINCNAHREFV